MAIGRGARAQMLAKEVETRGMGTFLHQEPRDRLDDEEALALIEQKASTYDYGRDPVQLMLEKQWFVNAAFFLGIQEFQESPGLENIDPNVILEETGYTANHIFRIIQGNVSRLSSARPQWDVMPNSADQADQDGAKAAKTLLDHAYDHLKMREKRRELGTTLETMGTAFFYVDWDPHVGDTVRVYRDPWNNEVLAAHSLSDEERQFLDRMGSVEEQREGDWVMEAMLPFQVKVPIEFMEVDKMPWIVVERIVSLAWIWDHYPDVAPDITPDELNTIEDNQYWRRLTTMVQRAGFTIPSRGEIDSESVRIQELWIPPSRLLKQGATVVRTRHRLLENSPHRFAAAGVDIKYPVTEAFLARQPGRFHGVSRVEHLIGPQREYNRARTQLIQHRDVLGNPQWMAPREINFTLTRNEVGDVWEYDAGMGKPELVQPPNISPSHVQTEERAVYDMQTISAQSEASQGQVPEGVRSGVAIARLQERDMQVLGPTVESMEDCLQRTGEKLLKLAAAHMKVPRIVALHGEYQSFDVKQLKGLDLNGNTKVVVRPSSMMPKSRAETMNTIFELIQTNSLNPAMNPKDRRMVWEALELPNRDRLFLMEDFARRRARIENEMFLHPEGVLPDVDQRDDHQAHYEEHLLFKNTDAYERMTPLRKMAFDAHLAKHELYVGQMMQSQMMMSQMAAGGVGGGGSPPRQPGEASQPAPANRGNGSEGSDEAA